MQRIRLKRVSALVAALLAVPLALLTSAPVEAVTGSAATDNTYAFTARLEIGEGDTTRACSGALVDADWLITAASCFADDPAASLAVPFGAPALKTTATIGRTDLTGTAGQVRNVTRLVPNADPSQDVVLAQLASPVTGIAPVAVSSSAPAAGEELQVAGYGRTKDEWAPIKLHTGTFTLDSVSATEVGITGKNGVAVCKGDTGGPLLRDANGSVELVGINSRSWQGGCFGTDATETRTSAVDTRADTLGSWISSTVATLPCDIYAATGTPCVAAHSTVRALLSSYDGPLYRVTRASDGASSDIGLLSQGGYANALQHDVFCRDTTCRITKVYDQTSRHNDLGIGPAGTGGTADRGADASELSVKAGGHKVYGIWISPGVGYRYTGAASGVAVNGQAEGVYMVASGTHANDGCCFDYGNAVATPADAGDGHMDAVSISTKCHFEPCTGSGPWVQADLSGALFQGANGVNAANTGNNSPFVTATLKNDGQTRYALKGGNSASGGLSTWWDGSLPTQGDYKPMHQEGGIVLGVAGNNANKGKGTFFEGAMVSGYPSDAAEDAVQANIASVGYSGETNVPNGPQGTIAGPGGQCVDVNGDDTGVNGTAVQLWNCASDAEDQHWTHNADGSLSTLGRCLDINGNGTANGTQVELWDCNGVGGQKWVQRADGSLFNLQSGRCLDSPSGATANGTRLQIYDCNGAPAQKFSVKGGGPTVAPGPLGTDVKCVDVAGDDTGGNGAAVQLWDCLSWAVDQHWYHNADGSLETLGRCLDINGNGTANGTQVELWDCNGVGGQKWVQQANGSLLNPQSGRCLDAPGGVTANGTRLQIYDCNGSSSQKFKLS
jgi:hypothetical protein